MSKLHLFTTCHFDNEDIISSRWQSRVSTFADTLCSNIYGLRILDKMLPIAFAYRWWNSYIQCPIYTVVIDKFSGTWSTCTSICYTNSICEVISTRWCVYDWCAFDVVRDICMYRQVMWSLCVLKCVFNWKTNLQTRPTRFVGYVIGHISFAPGLYALLETKIASMDFVLRSSSPSRYESLAYYSRLDLCCLVGCTFLWDRQQLRKTNATSWILDDQNKSSTKNKYFCYDVDEDKSTSNCGYCSLFNL